MSTLLLRLAAPLQSWGTDKFERRGTERAPTKSGIVGLVAAALGRLRNEGIEDLSALRFGVRVDQEGHLLRDFHTAKSVSAAYVTNRYYLSDAIFLAGLEGGDDLLNEIEQALRAPVFPLFLGRRSCPPAGKLSLGVRYGINLVDALREEPFLSKKPPKTAPRIVVDAEDSDTHGYFQKDMPVSFDQSHRKYGLRKACEIFCRDPMPELQESEKKV